MLQLFVYQLYGSTSVAANIGLLFVVGFLVNGPYALITTAVSADLGTHPDLCGSSRALATVTGIIDGTGSIGRCCFLIPSRENTATHFSLTGAAVGPLLAGYLSGLGWEYVFYALMVANGLAFIVSEFLINYAIFSSYDCFIKFD